MSRSHRRRSQPLAAPQPARHPPPDERDSEPTVEPLSPADFRHFGLDMYQQPGNTEATDGTIPEPRIPTPKVQVTYNGRVANTLRCRQLGAARVFVRLLAADAHTDETYGIDDQYMLIGERHACTPSWSAHGTKIIFRFPDLTCTTPGRYRLMFLLMILDPAFRGCYLPNNPEPYFTCTSDAFNVFARGSLAPVCPGGSHLPNMQGGPVGPLPSTIPADDLNSDSGSEGVYSGDESNYYVSE
jgi:hypothetical protein